MFVICFFIHLTIALITTDLALAIDNKTEYIRRINANYNKILACKDCCYPITSEFCQFFYQSCTTLALHGRLFLFSNKNITANDISDSYCLAHKTWCHLVPKADLAFLTNYPVIIINYKKIYFYEGDYIRLINEIKDNAQYISDDIYMDLKDANLKEINRKKLVSFKELYNNKTSDYKIIFEMHPLPKNIIEMNYTDIAVVLSVYYNEFVKHKPKRMMIFNKYRKEYCQDQLTNTIEPINSTTKRCLILNNRTKNTAKVTVSAISLLPVVSTNYVQLTSYDIVNSTSKQTQKKDSNSLINLGVSIAIVSGVVITIGIISIIFQYYKKRKYTVNFLNSETQRPPTQDETYQLYIRSS